MIKYLHVRALDENNGISSHGGISVAYTCTETEICMAVASCNDVDIFNYDVARKITTNRLKSPKCQPIVIALKHPITETIIEYLEMEWFDVPIQIFRDEKGRWVSDFQSIGDGEELTETDWVNEARLQIPPEFEPPRIPDDAYMDGGEMRYDG